MPFRVAAVDSESPDRSDGLSDYLRFAPVALPWAMKIAGQPTRSDWGRMAVSQGFGGMFTFGLTSLLKYGIYSPRPDGSDSHSLPSGHAAIAFMGATMAANELGWRSPWYTIGAYAFATGIGMERVINGRHYPTHVMAGAGIGILSTELGYYLGDMIFGDRGLDSRYKRSELSRDNGNFSYLSLSTGLMLPFGRVRAGTTVISRQPAITATLRAGLAVDDNFGVAVEGGLTSVPIITDVGGYRTYVKTQSSVGLFLAPYYTHILNSRLSLSAELGGGYRFNLPLNALDKAVECGRWSAAGHITVGVGLRLSDHFTARAGVGYELSGYSYTVKPSTAYMTTAPATTRGVSSALLISLSSRYEF